MTAAEPGRGVLFSPHSDDEALFASFTIIRHRPAVVVCFPSSGDYGDTAERRKESQAALEILGASGLAQWYGGDIRAQMRNLDEVQRPERVWAPDVLTDHPDHLAVAHAAELVFGDRLTTYHTYQLSPLHVPVKVRTANPVRYPPEWLLLKLRALACYRSQVTHPRASWFFAQDLAEYMR